MKSHHWTGEGTEGQRLPRPKKADIVAARRDLKQTRFLADDSVEVAVAVLLRRQGFNVGHIGRSRDLWRGAKIVFSGDGSYVVHTFEWDEGRIVTTRYRWRTDGHLEILAE